MEDRDVEGPTTFKIPVPDPVCRQIGVIVMMKANVPAPPRAAGGPPPTVRRAYAVQLALRLKVENRRDHRSRARLSRASPRPARSLTLQTAARGVLADRAASRADAAQSDAADRQRLLRRVDAERRSSCRRLPPTAAAARTGCTRPVSGGPPRPTPPPGIEAPPGGFRIQGCAEQLDSRAMSYITQHRSAPRHGSPTSRRASSSASRCSATR